MLSALGGLRPPGRSGHGPACRRASYHYWASDRSAPCRPTLEVEAVIRTGDADGGPLLLPVADYIALAGGLDVAAPCLGQLRSQGRVVSHLGVDHLAFPTWAPVDLTAPGGESW